MRARQPSSNGVSERQVISCLASSRVGDIYSLRFEIENFFVAGFVEADMQQFAILFQ